MPNTENDALQTRAYGPAQPPLTDNEFAQLQRLHGARHDNSRADQPPRVAGRRPFIVHMNLGWTKLLEARSEESGGDLIVRDERGWRKKHPEGGYLCKPLRELLAEQFVDTDPRRNNIIFFLGLRNQIEHRHEAKVAALVAGRTQALLINYEQTLVEWFGHDEALGSEPDPGRMT